MKQPKIAMRIITLMVCIICFSCANEYDFWGVWNINQEEWAHPRGEFFVTPDYLHFSSDYYGYGPEIGYDGGYYKIIKIISKNRDVVSFYLEDPALGTVDEKGEWITLSVLGKVILHFLDKDHIWLEVDRTDKNYPTNDEFLNNFFRESVVLWRAPKVQNKQ
jgi:hypothetical protein